MSPRAEIPQSASEQSILQHRGYRLVAKLGEGSYAKVYLAEYVAENKQEERTHLACKIIDTAKAPKDFVKKFLPRELDILVKLNHPHIIHVHSIFQRRSKYFMFMRYAENGDLLDFILKNGATAENQARLWFRQLVLAIQYLHELEIAHRDLKCENVLISRNFNCKIADFGFARCILDHKGKRELSETYCGSLSYAAPEILRGSPYNPKIADIWSLGVILYVMLNKAMPFDDTNIKRLHEQQSKKRWKFRSKVVDNLSDQVKKLVPILLEPDVTRRCKVEQILASDWIAMDSSLLHMTVPEQQALAKAVEIRKAITVDLGAADDHSGQKAHGGKGSVPGKDDEPTINMVELAAAAAEAGTEALNVIKKADDDVVVAMSMALPTTMMGKNGKDLKLEPKIPEES